ncbi:MAG: GDP-mannose 4,6-dehydratase [Caldilineaceae bacterium]
MELTDEDGEPLRPIPTTEDKRPELASVYALSKYDQERMCMIVGNAYQIPTVALRFFNIYGSLQALSNPYTGVLAIFASRLLNNNPPLIYEDGYQRRDFVHVTDIARACRLAAEVPAAAHQVFNIGSGQVYTIRELAARLATVLKKEELAPEITGKYRVGDIRHCFADIRRAQEVLGYEPTVTLEDGLVELTSWLEQQHAVDLVADAETELATRGLIV